MNKHGKRRDRNRSIKHWRKNTHLAQLQVQLHDFVFGIAFQNDEDELSTGDKCQIKVNQSRAYLKKNITNYAFYGNFISDAVYFLSNSGIEHSSAWECRDNFILFFGFLHPQYVHASDFLVCAWLSSLRWFPLESQIYVLMPMQRNRVARTLASSRSTESWNKSKRRRKCIHKFARIYRNLTAQHSVTIK